MSKMYAIETVVNNEVMIIGNPLDSDNFENNRGKGWLLLMIPECILYK